MTPGTASVDLETAQLVARVDCPDCDATGSVTSDDWKSFEEWRRRRPTLTPEDEDDLVEKYFIEVCDYSAVPPMGEECARCEASGKLMVEVPVQQLLEVVFEHVDRPAVATEELERLAGQIKRTITDHAMATRGLLDPTDTGSHLRAVQEGAEALRSLRELGPRSKEF